MKRRFFIRKFVIFISLTMVPICIFGMISAFYINLRVRKEASEKAKGTVTLMQQYMEEFTDSLEFYRISLVSNPRLHLALIHTLNNDDVFTEDFANLTETTKLLYYSQSTKPYIQSIYLTIEGSSYFINGTNRESFEYAIDGEWAMAAEEIQEQTFMKVRNIKKNKFDTATIPVVSVYQRLKYNELMVVNIRQDYFNKWLDSITNYENQMIFITDSYGHILFQNKNNMDMTATELAEKEGYFSNTGIFPGNYNLHYFSLIPEKEVFWLSGTILKLTAIAGILSIVLSSVLAYVYTLQDYHQIFQIIELFDQAEKGEVESVCVSSKNTPYFHIINNIIHLFMSQTYLKVQLDAKKYALSTAQLSALQYQLNPHFLFNTLQSIDLEILKQTRKPTAANHMISNLSELLRYSLSGSSDTVPLGEELAATKNYIELQNLRLGESFRVKWEYQECLLKFPILKLLLQPIIENSITHCGLESAADLVIKIKIYEKNGILRIVVIDNGAGISPEQMKLLQEQISDDRVDRSGKHIGLKNIGQRVRLAYRNGYIHLWSKQGMGTIVVIGGIEKTNLQSKNG